MATVTRRRRGTIVASMATLVATPMATLLVALTLLFPGTVHGAEPDLEAILLNIDRQMTLRDTDFAAVMTMLSQDPDKGLEKTVARFFRRDRDDQFLILIQEPAHQRGQGYLREGNNMWFYDPESRKFSHSSIKENIEGTDMRSSDVAKRTLLDDFRIEGYERSTLGQYSVYIVDLAATHNEVPDPFVRLWITDDTHLVLKEESYSLSKRHVRTVLYPSYQRVGDAIIPRQVIYIDELIPGKKTQTTITDVSLAPLDANVFTKAYIERVSR